MILHSHSSNSHNDSLGQIPLSSSTQQPEEVAPIPSQGKPQRPPPPSQAHKALHTCPPTPPCPHVLPLSPLLTLLQSHGPLASSLDLCTCSSSAREALTPEALPSSLLTFFQSLSKCQLLREASPYKMVTPLPTRTHIKLTTI